MRREFVEAMLGWAGWDHSVFLTGDLGFMALEPLRDAMGSRFINAGVAEQNMISVAAGLAKTGLSVWVYSIAPFCYARPFEQIRNDVCMHRLPVHLVGNGGGYGYGVMGSTHHALEDYGTLLTLPEMKVYVPAFACDIADVVERMEKDADHASYLRLGRCERPAGFPVPPYSSWRRLLTGKGPTVAVVGPIAGALLRTLPEMDESVRPEVWVVTELPLDPSSIPGEFTSRLGMGSPLWVVEEHVAQGSLGHMLAAWLLTRSRRAPEFRHFHASGYPSGRFGSQDFHRAECGIDAESIRQAVLALEQSLHRS